MIEFIFGTLLLIIGFIIGYFVSVWASKVGKEDEKNE